MAQTFEGFRGNYHTLAPAPGGPQPQNWGIAQQGNTSWSGVGSIPDGGALPLIVSNTSQATTYSAAELLAK